MPVEVVLSTPKALASALERIQKGSSGIEGLIQRLLKSEIDSEDVDADKLRHLVGDDAVIKLVDHLIEEAMRARASDIHIEPQPQARHARPLPHRRPTGRRCILPPAGYATRAVVSRIKVDGGSSTSPSNRKPQDGRMPSALSTARRSTCGSPTLPSGDRREGGACVSWTSSGVTFNPGRARHVEPHSLGEIQARCFASPLRHRDAGHRSDRFAAKTTTPVLSDGSS